MRKAEEFDADVLKSNDEYIDMINNLQNMYGEGDRSNTLLDDMIFRLIKGLNARFAMTEKAAKVNTKRQFKDWKVLQKRLLKHKEELDVDIELPEQEQATSESMAKPKNSLLVAFKRVFRSIGQRQRVQIENKGEEDNSANESDGANSLSEASPKAEQQTPKAEVVEDAKEVEVVVDNEEEQDDVECADDESDADEDVLKF